MKSFFDRRSEMGIRSRLLRVTRIAQARFDSAIALYQDEATSLAPCEICIAAAARSLRHHQARFETLVAALAEETQLPTGSVKNDLGRRCYSRILDLEGGR
jgi:hypothetical protein